MHYTFIKQNLPASVEKNSVRCGSVMGRFRYTHTHTNTHTHTHTHTHIHIYIFNGAIALWARTSSLSRLHDHAQTNHDQWVFSGRVISPTRRPLPDNTQHSQETDFHTISGTRNHNISKRAAADPRLRSLDRWDRLETLCIFKIFFTLAFIV